MAINVYSNRRSEARQPEQYYVRQHADDGIVGPLTKSQADEYARRASRDARVSPYRYAVLLDSDLSVRALYVNGIKVATGKVAAGRAQRL